MSKNNVPGRHSISRVPEQVSGPVRVCSLIKQEIREYYQVYSVKVPNLIKLSDSISLIYNYQYVQIIGKFKINANHFTNKDIRIYYIFNTTNRDIQYYLYTRYQSNTTNPFKIVIEMIDYLREYFINPYHIYETKREYKKIYINETQSFYKFKTKFIHLTNKAQININNYLNKIYNKLIFPL